MSLLKWDWQFRIEGGVHVRNYVAKERDKYLFKIEEVMRLPDVADPEIFGCLWQKAYLLDGYVIDNKYHTHCGGGSSPRRTQWTLPRRHSSRQNWRGNYESS